jgi:curved DNA-binding protein CbpA
MVDMAAMDPYKALGLNYKDRPTDAQIKTSYRKKALHLHPDRNKAPDANQKFL